ncbi:hypothetical protein K437DRAFT_246229 [Tilletiaria anomala UBC 951]|uniref:phosphoribosylglycinamide formyltransferase 1 n=1 Tax=Tilletiaria anomala (strain ATCC 24038 / CBS 436.72 / UBC 951) TaxID=1037660 RepID=A0A066VZT0_TILAU|nr:uncharacterized protein K437DRAFT_246229 [Tilletiaria anomala UBC 951]KDN46986.1 hypothetical protein K437DRAFT_246229 [Tilletiaria anomala UBC 951]
MAASTSPRPLSQQDPDQDPSELTDWVNTIAARATAAAGYSTQSASALQDEVRRAREERQNRRNRLSANGVRSLTRGDSISSGTGPLPSPNAGITEHTTGGSFRASGILSPTLTGGAYDNRPFSPSHELIASEPPAFPSHSIPKSPNMTRTLSYRSNVRPRSSSSVTAPVLTSPTAATAGGLKGHAGVSPSPTCASAGPVSLANFIGGKASGPRLGKLVGDGCNQPPEAALAVGAGERDSRGKPIALPGMAGQAAGAGLASFMKDHLPPGTASPWTTVANSSAAFGSRGIGTSSSAGVSSIRTRSRSPEKPRAAVPPVASTISPTFASTATTTYIRNSGSLSFSNSPSHAAPALGTSPSRSGSVPYPSSSPAKVQGMSWSERGIPSSSVVGGGSSPCLGAAARSPGKSDLALLATSPGKNSSYFPFSVATATIPGKYGTSSSPAHGNSVISPSTVSAASPAKEGNSFPTSGVTASGRLATSPGNFESSARSSSETARSPVKESFCLVPPDRSPVTETMLLKSFSPVRASTSPAAAPLSSLEVDSTPRGATDVPAWKAALLANRSNSGAEAGNSSSAAFTTSVKPSSSPSISSNANGPPAFATSHVERAPTASLTRLSAKKMVGQRLREAKARESQGGSASGGAAAPSSSTASVSGAPSPALPVNAPGLKDRWPAARFHGGGGAVQKDMPLASPTVLPQAAPAATEQYLLKKAWTPGKIATALPALAGIPLGGASGEARPFQQRRSRSPDKRGDVSNERSDLPPVRLPGLGGAVSPFAAARATSSSKGVSMTEAAPIDAPMSTEADDTADSSTPKASASTAVPAAEPLASLTKGRAKGPKRTAARSVPDASVVQAEAAPVSTPAALREPPVIEHCTAAADVRASAVTPLQGSQTAATTNASAFRAKQQSSTLDSTHTFESRYDDQVETRSPRAETVKDTGARPCGGRSSSPVRRSVSPVKSSASPAKSTASITDGLPPLSATAAPTSFHKAIPEDSNPTVSKLPDTEKDTFRHVKPSDRMLEKQGLRLTVHEGEMARKGDAASVVAQPSRLEPAKPAAPRRSTSGKKVVVLVSGSGSNLQALIDATVGDSPALPNAYITFVISNRKAAFGLTRAATSNPPIPTHVLALKTWQNKNPGGTREQYDEVLARTILDHEAGNPPDLIVLAGFMHIVSEHFLRVLGHKTSLPSLEAAPVFAPVPIINLHPAKPGAFDGAHAIERAFSAFQEGKIQTTGVMVHEVIAEVDRGKPVLVREVPIYSSDTLETLEERMHRVEHEITVEGARAVLERPPLPMSAPNPWDDVVTSTDDAAATEEALVQNNVPHSASELEQERLTSRYPSDSLHPREHSEQRVNEKPQFRSVKDALANWGASTTLPTTASPSAQPRPRRRTASRPSSMYASKESTLAAVQERPFDTIISRDAASPIKASPDELGNVQPTTTGPSSDIILLPIQAAQDSPPFDDSLFDTWPSDLVATERTISVDTLLISPDGSTTSLKPSEASILYDSEVHCIIHRFKDSDGLASTQLFVRRGRKAQAKDTDSAEERKLYELAKRYNCKVTESSPGLEPQGLSTLLGGHLITRQGPRQRFDPSNTQMYSVRTDGFDAYVDQVDLHTSNLASACSVVACLLGEVCVWHGKGSLEVERILAAKFAATLTAAAPTVQEEGKEDEMFWTFFDREHPYASSCLQAHRSKLPHRLLMPRAWEVGTSARSAMQPLVRCTAANLQREGVYVIELPLEIFVLVGPEARSKRQGIRFAIDAAQRLSSWRKQQVSAVTPLAPVHCVVYPSRTPRDLALAIRFWNDAHLDGGEPIAQMNVSTAKAALAELAHTSFHKTLLEDHTCLPVGISPEHL